MGAVMAKDIFNKVVKMLKKQKSYNSTKNISDYWFENKNILSKLVDDKFPTYSQTFDLLIRWYSGIGSKCQWEIIKYIENEQFKIIDDRMYLKSDWTTIDFSEFSFSYNDKKYTLKDFANSFDTSKIGGLHDLRGIDLSYIKLANCNINNCFFAEANFSYSTIQQVNFYNCIFTKSNFDYANIVNITYDNTSFGSISVRNTFINAVNFKEFSGLRNIKEPSYFWLIKELMKSILGMRRSGIMSNEKHSVFWCVSTENNIEKDNIVLVSYVDWFQYVTNTIRNIKALSPSERIKFSLALIVSKYWYSGIVLFIFSLIVNIIYSWIYYILREDFLPKLESISDCIYFSIGTFTSGFGDITPLNDISKIVVASEVIFGYIILAIFIYLLSKKINKLF